MPSWIADESKWEKAKALAEKQGRPKDYAYIMGIYKKMGGRKKAPVATKGGRVSMASPMFETAEALIAKGWIEVPEEAGASLWETVAKGAGHKYIKRIPNPNGKGYRYFYHVAHGGGVGREDHMVVGAAYQHEGGHYHITEDHGDGTITVRHDETGKTKRVSRGTLREALRAHHDEAIDKYRARIKQELSDAMEHGSPAQQAAARKRAKRAGVRVPSAKEVAGAKKQKELAEKRKVRTAENKLARVKRRHDKDQASDAELAEARAKVQEVKPKTSHAEEFMKRHREKMAQKKEAEAKAPEKVDHAAESKRHQNAASEAAQGNDYTKMLHHEAMSGYHDEMHQAKVKEDRARERADLRGGGARPEDTAPWKAAEQHRKNAAEYKKEAESKGSGGHSVKVTGAQSQAMDSLMDGESGRKHMDLGGGKLTIKTSHDEALHAVMRRWEIADDSLTAGVTDPDERVEYRKERAGLKAVAKKIAQDMMKKTGKKPSRPAGMGYGANFIDWAEKAGPDANITKAYVEKKGNRYFVKEGSTGRVIGSAASQREADRILERHREKKMKLKKSDSVTKAGGPYIGPKGGKWADPKHTIPWHNPKAPMDSAGAKHHNKVSNAHSEAAGKATDDKSRKFHTAMAAHHSKRAAAVQHEAAGRHEKAKDLREQAALAKKEAEKTGGVPGFGTLGAPEPEWKKESHAREKKHIDTAYHHYGEAFKHPEGSDKHEFHRKKAAAAMQASQKERDSRQRSAYIEGAVKRDMASKKKKALDTFDEILAGDYVAKADPGIGELYETVCKASEIDGAVVDAKLRGKLRWRDGVDEDVLIQQACDAVVCAMAVGHASDKGAPIIRSYVQEYGMDGLKARAKTILATLPKPKSEPMGDVEEPAGARSVLEATAANGTTLNGLQWR